MPSPLGSFLLTLSSESQHSVDSGEASTPMFVSDNAKIMRRASCASFSSNNDSEPDVLTAINDEARKAETKPTNWDRLCSPISERRTSVQKRSLSLPLRKLSIDNIDSMAKKPPARRRSQSLSLSNKQSDSFERLRGSGRNASYNAVFAASLKKRPASNNKTTFMPFRREVSEDDMPGLGGNNSVSASTKNATFGISQKGKMNPFIALLTRPAKEKDRNMPLECPQRKPSGDNMFNMMSKNSITSFRTPSIQANASFDTESLKRHGKKALLNPFKTEVDACTKEERRVQQKTVHIE
jgi:hypothetical protein